MRGADDMQRGWPPRWGLRGRFALFLVGMMLVGALALSWLWAPRMLTVMREAQLASLDQKMGILSDALVPFLLQNQFGGVFETLDSLLNRHVEWDSILLVNEEGQQLYPLSPVPQVTDPDMIRAHRVITFDGRALAQLTVVVDISRDLGLIRQQIDNLALSIAVILLGGVMLMGISLERWVLRPAYVLAGAARQMAEGNFTARIPPQSADEIGVLTQSFASMRQTIKENEASLIASRDEARKAAEVKSRFLATMSHEIRTPLNGVIPLAELLLEGDLDTQQRQLVQTIHDSGCSLKTLIDDVLDITKFDEDRFVIRSGEFDPVDLVRSVVNMLRVAAENAQLTLDLELDIAQAGRRLGDAQRLRQILVNLVGNAVKFTHSGGVRLRVTAGAPVGKTQWILFEVIDTGIGIGFADQERIFERFVQADTGNTREYQGSGLGLSICKLLVGAMGGTLELDSRPGEGSTFYFSLPFEVVETGRAGPPQRIRTASGTAAPTPAGKRGRILVVDDSLANLKVAQVVLASLNYQTISAPSGQEALNFLQQEQVDLILMDVHMPGMDGLETTRRIRASGEGFASLPILGLSASAFEEDVQKCHQAGMDGFLSKPLSKTDLGVALRGHIQLSGADSTAQKRKSVTSEHVATP